MEPTAEKRTARGMSLGQKGVWLVGLGLLANAGVMLYGQVAGKGGGMPDLVISESAYGQGGAPAGNSGQLLGARGIYMMPAQLGPNSYGLYLMDVDAGTICVYKALPDQQRFRLMAARSFRYDRYLEDFNNDGMSPKAVEKLVEDQRTRVGLQEKSEQPTVDTTTKPDENQPVTPASQPAGGAGGAVGMLNGKQD